MGLWVRMHKASGVGAVKPESVDMKGFGDPFVRLLMGETSRI